MQLKSLKLEDLYARLIGDIESAYPKAQIAERKDYTTIGFAAQMVRIFICQDENLDSLIMRISTNIYKKLSKENSLLMYISSLDDLNGAKHAAHIIMAQQMQEGFEQVKVLQKAKKAGQGYLLDGNRNQIGVVDLARIPTNAYITEADEINKQAPQITEAEKQEEVLNRARQGTIRKFFRR